MSGPLPYGWGPPRFDAFAKRAEFVCWAEVEHEHFRYAIVQESPHTGLQWAEVPASPDVAVRKSGGCYYDDMPGGAIEAAKRGAAADRQKTLNVVARFMNPLGSIRKEAMEF